MARAGIFRDASHVELLGGILVQKMTKDPAHNFSVGEVSTLPSALLTPRWVVRNEKSIDLARRWQPEPDAIVLVGPSRRYEAAYATPADVALLVEVADSSYARDRGIKWRKYAEAGMSTYWIINLAQRQVEVYREPAGTGVDAAYKGVDVYGEGTAVPVNVGGEEVGQVNVADLLPSASAAGA